MEWYVKIPLATLGVVELIIRLLFTLAISVLTVCIIFAVLSDSDVDYGLEDLLTPWCFQYIRDCERRQRRDNTPQLSLRQRRKLEFRRQELKIEQELEESAKRRKALAADIVELESGIGKAFLPTV